MALSLTDKIVGFLARPVETYRAVRDEELGPPVVYFLVLLIINAILTAIVAYLGIGAAANNPPGIGAFILGLIGAFIWGIIMLAFGSIFLHIGAKIMGGRGDIADSFKSAVYASTPNLLLGWLAIIPVIGWLIGIIVFLWMLALLFLGVRELHEMETTRAVIAVVIAAVLLLIVITIIAVILAILGIALIGGIAGIASMTGYVPPTY
jgi:hypothetical protein